MESLRRLAPMTAMVSGKSTARMLTASARCSRDRRTASERSVGLISKRTDTMPSSMCRSTS